MKETGKQYNSLLIEYNLFYREYPTEDQIKEYIKTQKELAHKEYDDNVNCMLVPKSDFVQRVREKFVSKEMDYLVERSGTDAFSDDKPEIKRSKMALLFALRDDLTGDLPENIINELCTYVLSNSNFDKVYMTCAKTKDGWRLAENDN